jgi:SAM-dependent methyltransferase
LRRAYGSVDQLEWDGDDPAVSGWFFHPFQAIDDVRVYVDGLAAGEGPVTWRADIARLFPHIEHAGQVGFRVPNHVHPSGPLTATVNVVGLSAGRETILLRSQRLLQPGMGTASPAAHLMMRVAGHRSPDSFTQGGLDATVDLMEAVALSAERRVTTVLDWGCGPGRVAVHIVRWWPELNLQGCDIDAEAIGWCNQNILPGAFSVTSPYPPLPYAAESFDAVLACSVMTHLSRETQLLWLAEISRVLRPGGVLTASVHGRFAAALFAGMTECLDRVGFLDRKSDISLASIAPDGYYRSVFQTPEFTRQEWLRTFPLESYKEAGLAGFQDLVVCRRR